MGQTGIPPGQAESTTPQDRKRRQAWVTAVYICFLIALAGWTFLQSAHDWDMVGYMAVLASWQTPNPAAIHHNVYQELHSSTSPATFRALTTGPFRGDVASNPWHLAEQLPFYSIKPLYVDLVWLAHRLGLGLNRSMRLISVVSVLALGILCFLWMRLYLTSLQSAVISACLFFTTPMHRLARFNEPDALNAAVLVASLYLLFEKRKAFPGLLLLCLSVFIRPDSAILALLVLGYLAFLAPPRIALRKLYALVLAGTVGASVIAIGRFGGAYGWKMLFINTFKAPVPNPGEITPVVTRADYWTALRAASIQLLSGSGLVLFVFFIALLIVAGAATLNQPLRDLLILLAAVIACHLTIFPSLQARFFAFALVPATVGYAACLSRRPKPYPGISPAA